MSDTNLPISMSDMSMSDIFGKSDVGHEYVGHIGGPDVGRKSDNVGHASDKIKQN